jgi:hypothetical protein
MGCRLRKTSLVRQAAIGLAALFMWVAARRAGALTINVTYVSIDQFGNATPDNGASFTNAGYNFANVQTAVNYAANEYQELFANPSTVNIDVTAADLTGQGGELGLSGAPFQGYYSYSQIRAALINNVATHPSANGTSAAASLPVTDPTGGSNFVLGQAEMKALGLAPVVPLYPSDGSVTFTNSVAWTFDPNNRQVAGKYDFIGTAEHEISEVMGRFAVLRSDNGKSYDLSDMYIYTAPGVRYLNSGGANAYFSVDNGVTGLPGSSVGNDYDGVNPTDPFNMLTNPGQGHMLNPTDIANMEALGYYPGNVPEPSSLVLAAFGFVGLTAAQYGWRRRNRPA